MQRISSGKPLLSNGAKGTCLQSRGLEPGGCPERFNGRYCEIVRSIVGSYFKTWSYMVQANSFGSSRRMSAKYGQADRVEELNRFGAEHVRSRTSDNGFAEKVRALVGGGIVEVGVNIVRGCCETSSYHNRTIV